MHAGGVAAVWVRRRTAGVALVSDVVGKRGVLGRSRSAGSMKQDLAGGFAAKDVGVATPATDSYLGLKKSSNGLCVEF